MSLKTDLDAEVKKILADTWTTREGQKVPEPKDVGLGNDGVWLDCTVLYADLADSTDLVNNYSAEFAAEVYKSYLHCASKIIKSEGGEITAFDGDRIMAVYIGGSKNTNAVRTGLKINYAVQKILNPAIQNQYGGKKNGSYILQQAVGIDTSKLLVARTGVRGDNDLVWVGRAANYAAKLCALRTDNYATWITKDVYDSANKTVKNSQNGEGVSMWEERVWTERQMVVYRSTWWWRVD